MILDKNKIYTIIAELLSYEDKPKSFNTVKNWASKDPKLLELLVNATILNMNDYKTKEDIAELVELSNVLKDTGITIEQLKELLEAIQKCK